nr:MAG TPA: hypothetical protein [Caudoviricetes sp.]
MSFKPTYIINFSIFTTPKNFIFELFSLTLNTLYHIFNSLSITFLKNFLYFLLCLFYDILYNVFF